MYRKSSNKTCDMLLMAALSNHIISKQKETRVNEAKTSTSIIQMHRGP